MKRWWLAAWLVLLCVQQLGLWHRAHHLPSPAAAIAAERAQPPADEPRDLWSHAAGAECQLFDALCHADLLLHWPTLSSLPAPAGLFFSAGDYRFVLQPIRFFAARAPPLIL